MALTTTQINQAYIAILGRPAIETESIVPGNASVSDVAASLIADKVKKGESDMFTTLADKVLAEGKDINSVSNADFVESLYLTLLNRDTSNDAEGKEFWLKALNDGASRKDLVDSFIKAVIAQKAANTQDYQKYATKVAEQSSAFVDSLYTKLLGRQPDEAGKAYWSGVIADGASFADVAASFANAAFIQGKDTADGVTIANKLEVANYATTNLTSFSKLATAQDKEAIKARLEQAITNTTSNAETIADAKTDIDSDANTFKAPGTVNFTTKADDKLGLDANGGYNTTKATNFNGTLNLGDATKGTIQKTDAVDGNPDFANGNILTVNVTGATKEKNTLNLADLPTTSGVNNLDIKASTARVSGDVNNKFTNSVTIDAGYTSKDQQYASEITVKHNLNTYNAGAQADKLTVNSGASIDTVNMGAGNDTIILTKGGGGVAAAKITNINAGAGNDTIELTVASDASGDYSTTIKSITGVETIALTSVGAVGDTASISYDAIKGNKAFSLKVSDSTKANSGDLTIKADNNTDIDVSQITNGVKEGASYKDKVATLTISDVKANATVKLNAATDDGKLADVITLNKGVANGQLGATIINFAKGDKISVLNAAGTSNDGDRFSALASSFAGNNSSGDLTTKVGSVQSVKINASGAITFHDAASGGGNKVTNVSLTDAQDIIAKLGTAGKIFSGVTKKAVIFQSGEDAYIIDIGGSATKTDDDVVIKLVGVNIGDGGIGVASNAVTLA